ncbi:hypothetical protein [Candidatus Pollutiaquabacter sp.]|uniref:hypothetical protein n=1 Tax=Candidatus Pollutiaquabacter sp. TaxID=3416354 RepID=UPI003D0A38A7
MAGSKPKRLLARDQRRSLRERMRKELYDQVYAIARSANLNKHERSEAFSKIKKPSSRPSPRAT